MTETAASKEPIKASEIDPKFKYELSKMHGSEKILKCFQCGTCTSDCPVARYSDTYRPRTLIHMAQLGLKNRVLNSDTLWLCAACFTCTDRCPQDVEVASVIRVLRNLAAEKGCVPHSFQGTSQQRARIRLRIQDSRVTNQKTRNPRVTTIAEGQPRKRPQNPERSQIHSKPRKEG